MLQAGHVLTQQPKFAIIEYGSPKRMERENDIRHLQADRQAAKMVVLTEFCQILGVRKESMIGKMEGIYRGRGFGVIL